MCKTAEFDIQASLSQQLFINDFADALKSFMIHYWNLHGDENWDRMLDDGVDLIARFQTDDENVNQLITKTVSDFMNTRSGA